MKIALEISTSQHATALALASRYMKGGTVTDYLNAVLGDVLDDLTDVIPHPLKKKRKRVK